MDCTHSIVLTLFLHGKSVLISRVHMPTSTYNYLPFKQVY